MCDTHIPEKADSNWIDSDEIEDPTPMTECPQISRSRLVDIVDVLESHPGVTQNEINWLVDTWVAGENPNNKPSERIITTLGEMGAYDLKKLMNHWTTDMR